MLHGTLALQELEALEEAEQVILPIVKLLLVLLILAEEEEVQQAIRTPAVEAMVVLVY